MHVIQLFGIEMIQTIVRGLCHFCSVSVHESTGGTTDMPHSE